MKVLITHELFPPDFAGGGEYVVLRTAQHLQRRGVEVQVLTSGEPSIQSHEGIRTVRLPTSRYRFNLQVGKIVQCARDVDLIQTFNYHACLPSLVAGRILRKPVVCTMLGLFGPAWLEMKGPFVGRAFEAWERIIARTRFDRIVYLSEPSRQLGLALGCAPERTQVIHYGIELDEYRPAAVKESTVLFVGKYDVRKGVDDVLTAASKMPETQFEMIGWGVEEERLRKAAPANVRVLSFGDRQTLRSAFARASVFILPSRGEGLPKSMLEAMASGCAVVSTLPLEYRGAQVPIGNVEEIVLALRTLLQNPERTRRLGMENRAITARHTWDAYTDALLQTYVSVLRKPIRGQSNPSRQAPSCNPGAP
jgi:glycosyltransferase involved in cell wall biosynthesis